MAETISFARGVPSPDLLAVEELADCARLALRDPAALSYAPPGGFAPLREWIAARHGVDPRRVLVTNGSLQGFVLLARQLLAGSERRVLVEAPTYDRPLRILAGLGADVAAVPLDADGLDPEALRAAIAAGRPPAFLYTIPTFQNPSGRTLPVERRRALAAVAREYELLVLEDDPYGLVRFEGQAPPTLFELDGGDGVVYSSSFSKTVAPGLRVGYLVVPERLVAPLAESAVSTYLSPAVAGQAVVFEFIRRGCFEDGVERICAKLRERRDAMADALATLVPDARFTRPEGGYFLWLELGDGVDEVAFVAAAAAAGVTLVPGADFFVAGEQPGPAVRLAYSAVLPGRIGEGVERLAAVFPAPAAV